MIAYLHGRYMFVLYFFQKNSRKGNAVESYRTTTYLLLMWKLLTGVIAEEMCDCLEKEKFFPAEQKGCRRGSRGTKDWLPIDKTVLKDFTERHTNLYMAWIDYKKVHDFVPHNRINVTMELFGTANNVSNLLEKSIEQWKLLLTSNGKDLREIGVKRGVFQGTTFCHCCLFWVRYLCCWYLER